jgi:glucose-1-phosphate thymidylyltransferase
MKGVILAGGTGSRLMPLTKATNKHLLPIYNKPMIYYPLQTLIDAGVKDILIVTGTAHAGDIFTLMGSGKDFGVKLTYKVQDEAGGIPQAIGLAEDFVGKDKFISINGDNIILGSIKKFAEEFKNGEEEARILLYETTEEEAKKAGVAVLEGEKVMEIIEKPSNPPTNWISTGVLFFSPSVFSIIKNLKPSSRGELEIAEVQNNYINKGTLKASKLDCEWMDAGSFSELFRANKIIEERERK